MAVHIAPASNKGDIEVNHHLRGVLKDHERQKAWLTRSKYWLNLPSADWTPKKVLGSGTWGIVGLWEYRGKFRRMPSKLAIKQAAGKHQLDALNSESMVMRVLNGVGNNHIVKLYRGYHTETGTGTSKSDPLPYTDSLWDEQNFVGRIYMEYVPNGDARHLLKDIEKENEDYVIPEEHLWRMLHCLASAILVLGTGSIDPEDPDPNWAPICHFDIKPENVLIGEKDNAEHRRLEIFKLADFGMAALDQSETRMQLRSFDNEDWFKKTEWRGTEKFMAPEQCHIENSNRIINSQINIWGVGAFIHRFITKEHVDINKFYLYKSKNSSTTYQVSGNPKRLYDQKYCPYSQEFIDILCACLRYNPSFRITAKDLFKKTQEVVRIYDSRDRNNVSSEGLRKQNEVKYNIPPKKSWQMLTEPAPDTFEFPKKTTAYTPILIQSLYVQPEEHYGPLFPDAGPPQEVPEEEYKFRRWPEPPRSSNPPPTVPETPVPKIQLTPPTPTMPFVPLPLTTPPSLLYQLEKTGLPVDNKRKGSVSPINSRREPKMPTKDEENTFISRLERSLSTPSPGQYYTAPQWPKK